MHTLNDGIGQIILAEDLTWMEFSRQNVRFVTTQLCQLDWTGIPVSPAQAGCRKVTATDTAIRVELGDFSFPARFPGNDYERPARHYAPDLRFSLTLSLDRGDLVVELSSIANLGDAKLKILVAPDFFTASTRECASLVLPVDYGTRIDFPRTDTYAGAFEPSAGWSLPIHGLFRAHGGMGLWCEDPDRDYQVAFNGGESSVLTARCRQLFDSMANGPRSMRFMIFERGADFRALARRCRTLRQASGRFKTLKEKAMENPEVAQLPGTVFWKHNVYYKQRPAGVEKSYSLYVARPDWNENEGLPNNWTAEEIFNTARQRGFDRVAVCNTGWNRDGFDAGYPERLPVNPERGTEADIREVRTAARNLSEGYFLSVHDNYIDAYESAGCPPEELLQKLTGVPCKTWIWRGGQAVWLCSQAGLKYARRDLPKVAEIFGRGCVYLDVTASVPLTSCWTQDHEQTRAEDWQCKRDIFKLAKQLFGALAVEGCGTDLFADLVDIGAYGGLHCAAISPRLGPGAVPIPLWQMVYHDSVLNYFGEGYSPVHGSEYRLYQALYTLLPTSFDDSQKRLSQELRTAYTEPMVEFEDLVPRTVTKTADGSFRTLGVARSVFGDGTQVIANFKDAPFHYGTVTIPPRDYVVSHAND